MKSTCFSRRLSAPALALLAAAATLLSAEWAVAQASRRVADVPYAPASAPGFDSKNQSLDLYVPRKAAPQPRPVVLFVHGGSWNSGSKNDLLYRAIGRRLARHGFVGVVMSYRLAPQVPVADMTDDCARALAWTRQHASEYGGDPARIVVMGHSAGGGLAALLATGADTALFARHGLPARGAVHAALLDDPAGLDMYTYLQKMEYPGDEQYLVPFGRDPAAWRQASALYHLRPGAPPISVFTGGKTYPSISGSAERYRARLQALGQAPRYAVLPGETHVGMVTQLLWPGNVLYDELARLAR